MLPFLPEEKSNHLDFWSLTKKEGVRSLLKGDSPLHSRPAFLSRTRRPTTSETGRRARSSSRNWGGNRMQRALLIRWALQYRTARGRRGGRRACPGYPQRVARYGRQNELCPYVWHSLGLLTRRPRAALIRGYQALARIHEGRQALSGRYLAEELRNIATPWIPRSALVLRSAR